MDNLFSDILDIYKNDTYEYIENDMETEFTPDASSSARVAESKQIFKIIPQPLLTRINPKFKILPKRGIYFVDYYENQYPDYNQVNFFIKDFDTLLGNPKEYLSHIGTIEKKGKANEFDEIGIIYLGDTSQCYWAEWDDFVISTSVHSLYTIAENNCKKFWRKY